MSQELLQGVFGISMLVLVYVYVLYPILLVVLNKTSAKEWLHRSYHLNKLRMYYNSSYTKYRMGHCPSVTLVVPCYNEIDTIRNKIDNFENLKYPKEKISMIVVDDVSDDGTRTYLDSIHKDSISVIFNESRKGKLEGMRRAAEQIHSDIIVFSDCSAMIDRGSITAMVRHFKNSSVGGVTGVYKTMIKNSTSRNKGEGLYWRYEMGIRKLESDLRSTTHATGALYAVRRDLFEEIEWRNGIVNDDFFIPLKLVEMGFDIHSEYRAVAREYVDTTVKGEFKRRCRIAMGNFQMISEVPELFKAHQYFLLMQLLSHKLLRNLSVFMLPVVLGISVVLASTSSFYMMMVVLQFLFYCAAVVGYLQVPGRISKVLSFVPLYFVSTNVASAIGFFQYLVTKPQVTWEKTDFSISGEYHG